MSQVLRSGRSYDVIFWEDFCWSLMLEWYLKREHAVFLLPVDHWKRWLFVFSWENIRVALDLPRCLYLSPQLISQTARAENPQILKKHSTWRNSCFIAVLFCPYMSYPILKNHRFEPDRKFMWPCSGVTNYQSPVFFGRLSTRHWPFFATSPLDVFSALDGPTFSQKRWPSKGRVNNFHRQRWFSKKSDTPTGTFWPSVSKHVFFSNVGKDLEQPITIYIYIYIYIKYDMIKNTNAL